MRANINLCDDRPRTIPLGMVGENNVTELAFDVSPWVREHGIGTVTLLLQRAIDEAAYPVSVVMDGTTAVYTLTAADLQYNGSGRAELVYTVDGKIAKSRVWSTFVRASLDGSGEAPEPWQSWVDEVVAAAASAEEAVAHYPYIGENGNWWRWNTGGEAWEDTEVSATGPEGPQGNPGQNGAPGDDGFSPTVEVAEIEGGHRVTITDADGPHVFDVMDGQGGSGGTGDHTQLTNRDAADQHPMSAITGLIAALAEKYQKPDSGIPKTDLADAVRASLALADSALQSAPVSSVAGKTGEVNLTLSDITDLGPMLYPITCTETGGVKSFDKTHAQIGAAIGMGWLPVVSFDGRKYVYANNKYSRYWFYSEEINQNKAYDLSVDSDNTVSAGTINFSVVGHTHSDYQPKTISDPGGYYTDDTVDGALQEIGAELSGINTLIGTGVIV